MRALSKGIGSLLLLALIGCAAGPTEQEILESLQATLRSVTGDWHAESFGANAIALDFRLQEDGNGNVSGSGRMRESGSASVVPFTVVGTYRRPMLALSFNGLRYAGAPVRGALEGEYVTVAGISAKLRLTGPNATTAVQLLLQEE